MNAVDILFRTKRFNLSKLGEHFINPCCFGEDLAAWLRINLANKGVEVSSPGQEDWGWYLQVKYENESYFLGMSGISEENPANVDEGEWRIIVEKNRSFWRRVSGGGKIVADDSMVTLIEEILRGDTDFRDIRRDAGG